MADISDVEASIVAFVTQIIYPNGTAQPSAIGAKSNIYRGWPTPAKLDADLTAGTVNISVFPMDVESRTTRYLPNWQSLPVIAPTLTLTASGGTVTVAGTPASPLNAAAIVNGQAFVYPVQPTDTLTSIATGLAALINARITASSSGPVITIPSATRLVARVGGVGSVLNEIRRQKRNLMVTLWCPTPTLRDSAAAIVDPAFAAIDFLTLPDGSSGRILYERSRVMDTVEKYKLYRRDLIYSVEYGTTQVQSIAQIVAEIFNITGGIDPTDPPITSFAI